MKTHRMSGTKEYQSWNNMKRRCTDPKNKRFAHYGGKGISYCPEWERFEAFYADMGPSNGMTLERIDNDKNYEPTNCKWVPLSAQAKNTSRVRYITAHGETMSIADWARKIGVRGNTITMRINCYGWTPEQAVSLGGKS